MALTLTLFYLATYFEQEVFAIQVIIRFKAFISVCSGTKTWNWKDFWGNLHVPQIFMIGCNRDAENKKSLQFGKLITKYWFLLQCTCQPWKKITWQYLSYGIFFLFFLTCYEEGRKYRLEAPEIGGRHDSSESHAFQRRAARQTEQTKEKIKLKISFAFFWLPTT